MIKEFVKAWDLRKDALQDYVRTHGQNEYNEYKKLVKLLFDIVINPGLVPEWDTEHIHVIDDGDYQGTQLFIIPHSEYQPNASAYVATYQWYGSCSGCDLLMGISNYEDELPTEEQVREYMTLLLHLLQRCKYIFEEEEL